MDIKNDTEFLVREEVHRRRGQAPRGGRGCWCPLCESDMVALALNRLPPRYCHHRSYGIAASLGMGARVREAVASAVEKVAGRPRHRPGSPDAACAGATLENHALELGTAAIEGTIASGALPCACRQCRADTLAYALNHYPAKYGVTWGGRQSYLAQNRDFIRHEIGQLMDRAARIVAANPNH